MRKSFVIFLAIIFTGFVLVSTLGSSLFLLEIKTKSVAVSLPVLGKDATIKFCVMATAYGPPKFPEGSLTYSGKPVKFAKKRGTVAINLGDPRIHLGSELKIEGFPGVIFDVEDTGAFPVGYLDVYLTTAEQVNAFGLRSLEVQILKDKSP